MKSLVRKRLRTILTFVAWGSVIGIGLGLIIGQLDERPLFFSALRGAGSGILIGASVGIGEELIFPRWSRRMGFVRLSALRVTTYTLAMIAALILVNSIDVSIILGLGPLESVSHYLGGELWRDLLFAFIAAVLTTSFLQVRRLHNPGEIRRLLTGRYHYPEEEKRIFLFADLVGSTGIAERLGHLAYSSFLRDCFSDVSEARKDLAFHGDTLNTTARLEAMCKELGVQCLVSEFVQGAVELPDHLSTRSVGTVVPRGRTAALQLFAVELVGAVDPS